MLALGIEAASFCEARAKDTADSPPEGNAQILNLMTLGSHSVGNALR